MIVRMDLDVQYCAVMKSTLLDVVWKKALPFTKKKSIETDKVECSCAMISGRGIFSILVWMGGLVRTMCPLT